MAARRRAGERIVPFRDASVLTGVTIRLMREDDIEAAREAAWRLWPQRMEAIDAWWADPACWPTLTIWRDRVLQYDFFHLQERGHVRAGLTLRPDSDRPPWFWRECRRPVIEQLLNAGYRTMDSYIRADRPDFVDAMRELWAASVDGYTADGQWVHLVYDLERCLAQCTGAPERKSIPGWRYDVGPYVVREAYAVEPLMEALTELWGSTHPRLAVVMDELLAGWELDRGAVLAAERDGIIRAARMIRPRRRPGWCVHTFLEPVTDTEAEDALAEAGTVWQLAVGYEVASVFIPDWMAELPAAQARRRYLGPAVIDEIHHERTQSLELRWDLRRLAAYRGIRG